MFFQMFISEYYLLIASLLALAIGPILHHLAGAKGTMLAALDDIGIIIFVIIAILSSLFGKKKRRRKPDDFF